MQAFRAKILIRSIAAAAMTVLLTAGCSDNPENEAAQLPVHGPNFVGVKLSSFVYQYLGEVGIYLPVSIFVCLCQSGTRNISANSAMIKFWLHCSQAGFDVAKTLSIGYLGKSHAQVLVETRKSFYSMVASVFVNASVELFFGKKV